MYVLPKDFLGYEAGTLLRDVTIREARAMECNHCGGCCDGTLPDDVVKKDPVTGLPLVVWGSKFPEDLYEGRYGKRMLQPIVMGDGGITVGKEFEIDDDGKPYTAFKCSFHQDSRCSIYDKADPADISTIRPRNCGTFPVFGLEVDDAIVVGHAYVPSTGALPQCTWHGIRVVGPWKNTDDWKERWEKQQAGEEVPDLSIPTEIHEALIKRLVARRGHDGYQGSIC